MKQFSKLIRSGQLWNRRELFVGLCLGFLLVVSLLTCFYSFSITISSTIRVPDDFPTIQEAINNATDGDTILVSDNAGEPKIYFENLVVNKSITLMGTNADTTIIDAEGNGTAVKITAPNVIFNAFTMQNGGAGLRITNTSYYNHITYNKITNNNLGLSISDSTGNILSHNNMTDNNRNFVIYGRNLTEYIHTIDASNTVNGKPIIYWINHHSESIPANAGFVAIISSTNITGEGLILQGNHGGILILNSTDITVKSSNLNLNTYGIWIQKASNVLVEDSTIMGNWHGIDALQLVNSTIENVVFSDTTHASIQISDSSYNLISNNLFQETLTLELPSGIIQGQNFSYNMIINNRLSSIFSNNWLGISLAESFNNTIVGNTIENQENGINLAVSNGNILYHNNFISNDQNWIYESPDNDWDNGKEGNYWSNYEGEDANGDGIGDTPHKVDILRDPSAIDNCPLMEAWRALRAFNSSSTSYVETPNQKLSTFSNSTLASIQLSRQLKQISLIATSGYSGFLNIAIPRRWLDGPFEVKINGSKVDIPSPSVNSTHSTLYINYSSGSHNITIIGMQLGNIRGDLDGDGDVDLFDAVAFLINYGNKEDLIVPEPYSLEETTP